MKAQTMIWRSLLIALIAAFVVAQPVFAVDPPQDTTIIKANGYGDVDETGDILLITHYDTDYGTSTVPSVSTSQTLLASYLDVDPFDYGYDFDGAATYIGVTDATEVQNIWDGGGTARVYASVDGTGEGGIGALLWKENGAGTAGWYLNLSSQKLRFHVNFNGGANPGTWISTSNVFATDGTQYMIEVEYDSDDITNDPVVKIDGTTIAMTENATPSGTRDSDVGIDLIVGNRAAADRTWDGVIREAALYNAASITDSIRFALDGTETSLQWLLPMDEATGTTAFDATGNSNHGTITTGAGAWAAGVDVIARYATPFVMANNGYGQAIIGIYFDATDAAALDIVHADADQVQISANPAFPEMAVKNVLFIDWQTKGSQSVLEADLVDMTYLLEEQTEWASFDLMSSDTGRNVLTVDGETYLENNIPRLRETARNIFSAVVTSANFVERTFDNNYQTSLEGAWTGTILEGSFDSLATWWGMPAMALSTTIILIISMIAAGLLASVAVSRGVERESAAGMAFIISAIIIGVAAFNGIFHLGVLAVMGFMGLLVIAATVWLKRA